MMKRYLTAVVVAIGATTSLVWMMHALVAVSHSDPREPRSRATLKFVSDIGDSEVKTVEKAPIPPRPPIEPPPRAPPIESNGPQLPVAIYTPAPTPQTTNTKPTTIGQDNSALINIINAQPDYPVVASTKGIEGYVIVAFDVTKMGTIENVEVIESSNSIFNKSAKKAAYRSRYKPRTIDGVPQRTVGLSKKLSFELEN